MRFSVLIIFHGFKGHNLATDELLCDKNDNFLRESYFPLSWGIFLWLYFVHTQMKTEKCFFMTILLVTIPV